MYRGVHKIRIKKTTGRIKLKNPWSCRGWLGKYSPNDNIWRDNLLRKELRYDPEEASKRNDGIFWIRWDDVLLYFRNIQLSWNPKLFSYRMTTHGLWPKVQGPKNDTFNVGENPQYIIATVVDEGGSGSAVAAPVSRRIIQHLREYELTPVEFGEITE